MCGTESSEMVLEAGKEAKSFSWDGLRRYERQAGKADRFDACTYTIQMEADVEVSSQGKIRV